MNLGDLADLATFLGVPIAILLFVNEKARERRDREYGTYDALDEKYREYLLLCMEHPRLGLYDVALDDDVELDPLETIQQLAMFDILVSLLERSFLMYADQSTRIKRRQWEGWRGYIDDYFANPRFRGLWAERGEQFDTDFVEFMNGVHRRVTPRLP